MIRAIIFALIIVVIMIIFTFTAPFVVLTFIVSIIGALKGNKYCLNLFIVFDQFINAFLCGLLNKLFKNPSYKFGNHDETISSVFGKNILFYPNTTDKSIIIVNGWLSKADPQSKNHSVDSIEHDEGN